MGRSIEIEFAADRRDGFRGRRLPENGLCDITRQKLRPDKDQERHRDQGQRREGAAGDDQPEQHWSGSAAQPSQTRSATRMPDIAKLPGKKPRTLERAASSTSAKIGLMQPPVMLIMRWQLA